jgi:superfamily II DNA/RNA helicase
MFSSELTTDIQRLAGKFLHNYLSLDYDIMGGAGSYVQQHFHYLVKEFEKRSKLTDLITEAGWLHNLHLAVLIKMVCKFCYHYDIFTGCEKTLVFVRTKHTADSLAVYLSKCDIPTRSFHGDQMQRKREMALRDFNTGRTIVLVATADTARALGNTNTQFVSC